MQHPLLLLNGLAALLFVSACATFRTVAEPPAPRPLAADYDTYRAQPTKVARDTTLSGSEVPTDELTLRQALGLALLRNPDLAVFSWEIRASEARALQASLRPNPEFSVEIENLAGSGDFSGVQQTETTLQLSQLVELAGKRRKRTRVAALAGDLAAWDYEIKRLAVLTEVTVAFIDVVSSQRKQALSLELVKLAQDFVDVVGRRVQAGATSPAEASRARVALSNAEIELERSKRALAAARKRLAATWGSTTPSFRQAAGTLEVDTSLPELTDLAKLISQNPQVARWVVEMQQRLAVLSLERARRVPDPTVGAGFRRLSGSNDNALAAALSIPLPFFDRNQGAMAAAQAKINQAEWQQRAARIEAATQLAEAYQTLATAFTETATLENTVMPEAQKAFDTINEGYKLGKFGFLDVLDAQRTLFDSRSQYLRALTEYQKAKAEIEKLVGQSLDSIQ